MYNQNTNLTNLNIISISSIFILFIDIKIMILYENIIELITLYILLLFLIMLMLEFVKKQINLTKEHLLCKIKTFFSTSFSIIIYCY